MTSSCRGLIREEECSDHKYVEWGVNNAWLPNYPDILISPTFRIGTREYVLHLLNMHNGQFFELRLLRTVMSENDEVRCFIGVKRRDGSYHHEIANEEFKPGNLEICRNPIYSQALKGLCMDSDGHFSFFVLMHIENTQEGRQACKHVFDGVMSGEGVIRKEECSGHICVEWDLKKEFLDLDVVSSESFIIGKQRYILQMEYFADSYTLIIFRKGPSDEHPLGCIAGMKRGDGTHDHRIQRNYFEQLEEYAMWRNINVIYGFSKFGVRMLLLTADNKITFFVLMNVEGTPPGAEECSNDASKMTPSGEGGGRVIIWRDFVEVDWVIDYAMLWQYEYTMTCPVFKVGDHRFLMGFNKINNYSAGLRLFVAGPKIESRVGYCLGAKRPGGSYDDNGQWGELIQADDNEFWQIASETLCFNIAQMERVNLSLSGHLTVCVEIYFLQTPSVCRTCTLDDDDKSRKSLYPVLRDDVPFSFDLREVQDQQSGDRIESSCFHRRVTTRSHHGLKDLCSDETQTSLLSLRTVSSILWSSVSYIKGLMYWERPLISSRKVGRSSRQSVELSTGSTPTLPTCSSKH